MLIFTHRRPHSRSCATTTSTTISVLTTPPPRLLIPRLLGVRKPSTPPPEPEDERDEPA
jgi:hypothetical protein